jgi:hypothetical protein
MKMPHRCVGEFDHPPCNPAAGHEGARQDEKRQRQQWVDLHCMKQLLRQRQGGLVRENQQGQRAGESQGDSDGNTDQKTGEQRYDQE